MNRIFKKNGFASMVEIIITAAIFSVAAAGIYATVASVNPKGISSTKKLEAAYIGKSVMEQLKGSVAGGTAWGPGGTLSIGPHTVSPSPGVTVSYNVIADPSFSADPTMAPRQVTMTITY
jgi:hypothetical protein